MSGRREEAKGGTRRCRDTAFTWCAWESPRSQCGQGGFVLLALACSAARRLGESAPRWPAGSPAQWQRPRMWICVGPRDPPTKPSRGWLRVVVRKPRLVLFEYRATRNKVTATPRSYWWGCVDRSSPARLEGQCRGIEYLRALDCGRGHRDRWRCEWKARRRVCLVVVWCCVRSFGIVLWDFAGFPECFSALSSGRATARAAPKLHEKDPSHTQLRVSAPLNSPSRSQVACSAMRRLFLPVFSPFPLLALLLSLVSLCVIFFTRSPLPTPARLCFCACVLLRAVSCRCHQWR